MQLSAYTASSVLELLNSVTSSNPSSANATRSGRESSDPFGDIFGGTAMSGKSDPYSGLDRFPQMFPQISSATIDALLAAQSRPSTASPPSAETGKPEGSKDLFAQLDADGDGQVTKSEFEATATSAATSSYNVMKEMIARQMQAFASSSSEWMRF
ncbi:EF-hand domain-containing protein [Bradyrhizobium sp.]|uniref:EF-hand domain-containing protein n=1 Tax=Bradyrhizobium sp. TaxID=376 RepID=UPI0027348873|nr:EF-hand domain-containing protein [Bradyrhizobium sp.]MDP3693634.1 EF-hand domain-containing protein [Bradyrhizobium sp.]